eukprot:6539342-Prorocentrum_lima.AAC.1
MNLNPFMDSLGWSSGTRTWRTTLGLPQCQLRCHFPMMDARFIARIVGQTSSPFLGLMRWASSVEGTWLVMRLVGQA